jgi:hypothetical protein
MLRYCSNQKKEKKVQTMKTVSGGTLTASDERKFYIR